MDRADIPAANRLERHRLPVGCENRGHIRCSNIGHKRHKRGETSRDSAADVTRLLLGRSAREFDRFVANR